MPVCQERTVLVEVRFVLPVRVPAAWDDDQVRFQIEDNGCPGTRDVGAALGRLMARHEEASTCWACAIGAESKVLDAEVSQVPVEGESV